jgi:hypothetical protein
MAWKQPQLADPLMGPTDEIKKLQHRLLYAYPANSPTPTTTALSSRGCSTPPPIRRCETFRRTSAARSTPNPASSPTTPKLALGVIVLPPKAPKKKFVQQGVGYDTSAFLMGNAGHSYVMAVRMHRRNEPARPAFGTACRKSSPATRWATTP